MSIKNTRRKNQRNTLSDGQGATKKKPIGSHRRTSGRHKRAVRDLRP